MYTGASPALPCWQLPTECGFCKQVRVCSIAGSILRWLHPSAFEVSNLAHISQKTPFMVMKTKTKMLLHIYSCIFPLCAPFP